jgi:hypothetical protein
VVILSLRESLLIQYYVMFTGVTTANLYAVSLSLHRKEVMVGTILIMQEVMADFFQCFRCNIMLHTVTIVFNVFCSQSTVYRSGKKIILIQQ